jgi:hypothetical protein
LVQDAQSKAQRSIAELKKEESKGE